MRKVILYILTSIDGYIARKDGEIDWIFQGDGINDYGYNGFIENIDITFMGYNTYTQVLTFGEFPYKNFKNYVISSKTHENNHPYVEFLNKNIPNFVKNLKKQEGKDIWLIGGAGINTLFFRNNLVDEIILTIQPILLGEGISLTNSLEKDIKLKFILSKSYDSGLIQNKYSVE